MMTETQEKEEKYSSEQLRDILMQLSTDQMRFVIARQEFSTDKEAAEAVGISAQTVYRWPDIVKEAVKLMAYDGIVMARVMRRKALAKAMAVKIKGLDLEDNDGLVQKVATEIIEWEMGRATQPTELSGPDGGPIETKDVDTDQHNRAVSTLAKALGSILPGTGAERDGDMDAAE